MKKGTSRKYTQKLLSPSSIAEGGHIMAEDKHVSPTVVESLMSEMKRELQSCREAMAADIKAQLENMHRELKNDITSLRAETKAEVGALREDILHKMDSLRNAHAQTAKEQKEMGGALSDVTDRLVILEKNHDMLTKDHKKLQEKCTDLENRSRRQNLRVVGIAEGIEAGNPSRFVAEFFPDVLGAGSFDTPLLIDRAHRSLAPKPRDGERPRALIVRLHYYADKEKILKLSREKGRLIYKGSPVHIFPDMSPEVGKQRAAFNQVKAGLRQAKIPYSMYYPAKLTFTLDNIRHSFTNPQDADTFIRANITHPAYKPFHYFIIIEAEPFNFLLI
uniref:L1 transposable element RRM domain-containing protein n=1 Tax=Gouania willdenowi TaxID=441366 RepID=A0A8C5GJL6_GOUWI